MKFATKAIHEGIISDPVTGAIMPPIYMTSTYEQEEPSVHKGYDYTRAGNPNFSILEKQIASLEEGKYATVFSSGLGALSALLSSFKTGDKIVALEGLYGGTFRLLDKVFAKFGLSYKLIAIGDEKKLSDALKENPKLFLFETPSNPLMGIHDIAELAKKAKAHKALVLVDNTFATPFFQNPLLLGADIVWHSTTKYIGGHSDIIGGAMVVNQEELKKSLDFARMAVGVNPSPFDAWLLSRSIKTLPLRMEKHASNAKAIVDFLSKESVVKKIYYPGLPSHPGYAVAKKQMRGFSGMLSAEFNLPIEDMHYLISHFKYFKLAESLGGIESLVCHPASMTHASIPKEIREETGITDGLVRFSVGVEDPEDLISDLKQSLKEIQKKLIAR